MPKMLEILEVKKKKYDEEAVKRKKKLEESRAKARRLKEKKVAAAAAEKAARKSAAEVARKEVIRSGRGGGEGVTAVVVELRVFALCTPSEEPWEKAFNFIILLIVLMPALSWNTSVGILSYQDHHLVQY